MSGAFVRTCQGYSLSLRIRMGVSCTTGHPPPVRSQLVPDAGIFDLKRRQHEAAVEKQGEIAEAALHRASVEFQKLHTLDPSTRGK